MSLSTLIVFGTRPEIIKLAPVILAVRQASLKNEVALVSTSQHDELLEEQLRFWKITPDYFLTPAPFKGNLVRLLSHTLSGLQDIIDHIGTVEYIVVQGDTNTALACSTLSFMNRIKLIHIEAGLRTFDFENPFPEEYNRVITSKTAWFHFAPTELSKTNLINEGVDPSRIMVVGNTIVDALYHVKDHNREGVVGKKNLVIITLHRRENIDHLYKVLIDVVTLLSREYPNLAFAWITHPNCAENIEAGISGVGNIRHYNHIPYNTFVELYGSAKMVITDSGGVSEEAIHLGLPLIIFRRHTERVEAFNVNYPMIVSIE
ncbi:MAG: non-hydrolyzing UDP-N-acetylglucosamine 2-epimerase [Bacteroidales bacterium]